MRKNLIHATFSLFTLIIFTSAVNAQWIKTNWPASTGFFSLYAGQNRVVARTWDSLNGGRAFLTVDNGANWTRISSADSSIGILSAGMLNNDLLAGTWNGLYRSASDGANWNAVTPAGIPRDTAVWSISMTATTLFAGTRGAVYKSSDSGTTWIEIKSGIPANARIRTFAAIGKAVFAGSDSCGIFITTDSGTTWTAVNSGLADKRIFQLAAKGTTLFAATLSGVFISRNNGASWAANSSSLRNSNCFLAVNNQLFAGTDSSGVSLSTDSGATWSLFSAGMPAGTRVWSLAASSDNLFAGTNSGVWRTPLSITTVKSELFSGTAPSSRLRFKRQNNSRATIEFTLVNPETVDLEVYDLCGNKILSRVHKRFGAGLQSISFNTVSIAQGPYIIRLMAGMRVYQQTVPMLR